VSKISVVIITKNESQNIVDCIVSAKKLSDDIIVVDSGSTDNTVSLATAQNVSIITVCWNGYGDARNKGAKLAANNWILSLDADERITDKLAASILSLNFNNARIIYGFRRLNFFGAQKINYGALAHDKVYRLYNRTNSYWNAVPVHEQLVGKKYTKSLLPCHIEHYGIRTGTHYLQKKTGYAYLCAVKYKLERKKFTKVLRYISPAFNFIKAYFFQLGFLDKRIGFIIAMINAQYTKKKYETLQQMKKEEKKPAMLPGKQFGNEVIWKFENEII
jgi:glycosyltransferase involved in cell wall biosynthesis